MPLVTSPPRSTRVTVVWPAGPSGLSVEGGSTPAAADLKGPASSRHGCEQKPKVWIKEESPQEENDYEDKEDEAQRHAPHDFLVKDDADRLASNAARFPRPSYYEDGRVSGGRIRRRRLSSPRPAPTKLSGVASRQPENYESYDSDEDEKEA